MPPSKPKLTNEGQIPGEGSSVGAISFSPDGSLLATGNDLGILTVRFMHIFTMTQGGTSHMYNVQRSRFGNLTQIGNGCDVYTHSIGDWVHWRTTNMRRIDFTALLCPCGLVWGSRTVVRAIPQIQYPTFTPDTSAYSAHHPHNILWRIPPGDNSWIQLLAVWNMAIGIEWYSLADRRHLSTTTYQSLGRAGQRRVVRLVFIDEKTIAMGHVDGQVVIASWCCKRDPPQFSMQRNDKKRGCEPLSAAIAFHVVRGTPTLLTANGEGRDAVLVLLRVDLPPDDAGDLLRFQLATNPGHFMFNTFYCTCTGFILFVSVALLVLALVISNWPLFVVTSTTEMGPSVKLRTMPRDNVVDCIHRQGNITGWG
ncbi:uncharacterized protein LACBIDRAFT_323079 [Laccaria bicolor S238N-H82]|uniref:Predicted protein n=1 Tax=Laccaria bicolor (strain S238N-H82 / ATCC MYA-4686) TaxID=486041 RepID=B0CW19_LACBS|nr:uncharacterized protein LACBIDRAFT_323079 [Laccaria bicolor S238N-H82]EDR13840.1 predicted protein [Laccaria bicolor S238N-H82]|eukprot:XP_001876338.1 predicted protein [Laccaria bicolor S238N-H82]